MHRVLAPTSFDSTNDGGHLPLGLCHYMAGVMPLLRQRKVWLVRQETLAADLGNLSRWLELKSSRVPEVPNLLVTNRTGRRDPPLSRASRKQLRHLLSPEYALLSMLEHQAVNHAEQGS